MPKIGTKRKNGLSSCFLFCRHRLYCTSRSWNIPKAIDHNDRKDGRHNNSKIHSSNNKRRKIQLEPRLLGICNSNSSKNTFCGNSEFNKNE